MIHDDAVGGREGASHGSRGDPVVSPQQLTGVGLGIAIVGIATAAALDVLGPASLGAAAVMGLLFAFGRTRPVQALLDEAGGIVAAAVVALFLLGTGGTESVLQDVFVIILVYAAVTFGLRRLAVDVAAVAVAGTVVGLVGDGAARYYADFAIDLAVWTLVAVLAGVIDGRRRDASAASHRIRAAVDDFDDLVSMTDVETLELTYVNLRAAELVGRRPSDLVGQHLWELGSVVSEAEVRGLVAALEVGGDPVTLEHTSRLTSPPTVFQTSARIVPADGATPQLVLVARDVTDQRAAAATAREQAAMVDAADTAMVGTDLTGWVRSWNRAAEELYGVARDEAIGRHVSEVMGVPPDDPAHGREPFSLEQRALRWSTRHRRHGSDGDVREFDVEVAAWLVGSGGDQPGVALLARDITATRRATLELRRRKERFRNLAEQASGVVYRMQLVPEPRLTYLSPRIAEVLGDDPTSVQADPSGVFSRIHPDDGHPFADQRRWDEGVHTYRVRRTDGAWVWLEDHHRPERDGDGRVVASQGILFDISTRKELEVARRQALEHERAAAREVERTVNAQHTFLRSISHELRTPLTSVRGFAHTLRDHRSRLDEGQADVLLARLVANVERLDAQLADLLDLDLAVRGPATAQHDWDEVDVRQLLLAAAGAVDPSTHDLEVEAPPGLVVVGDGVRLTRAVTRLVQNAVRHTPPGTSVRLVATAEEGHVRVAVDDDGPGVDPAVRDTVFEPFVQGEAAASDPNPGAGVGLALVREVVTLHAGEVGLEPLRPHGSRFWLRLPVP